ncbi:hypothetical protein QZH41_013172 [Actinostola sp. cb2023]|nr:hypothetical protein QZH41_013172 [Actinostola sp. cb2023]
MGDNIEDPMENSGDEDIERPPTPDYHHDEHQDEEEVFSNISDNEDNEGQHEEQEQPSARPVIESPVSEPSDPGKDEQDSEELQHVSSPSDSEKQEEHEETNSVENTDSISKESEYLEKETLDEDEDDEDQEKTGSPIISDNVAQLDNVDTTDDQTPKSTDSDEQMVEKHDDDGHDDEEFEMPLSPIGLGLSEPETAIVDDILKGDVEGMMTEGHSMDSIKDEEDEESIEENEEGKEEKTVSDDEDEENVGISEDVDILDERSEPEEAGDQLIADIFGASDEEEEFEGFDQEEIEISKPKQDLVSKKPSKPLISDEEDEGVSGELTDTMVVPKPKDDKGYSSDSDEEGGIMGTVWDFDVMMEQKKASRAKRRRRKGDGDLISDNDDLVVEMVKQMKQASEDDRMLNEAKQAATKKLKLLPLILTHLNKADLQFTFIDSGILHALKDWLSPLPDGSLPHLQIRTGLLKILSAFPALDTGALKMSGLGKAVMYIFRHPKEVRQNKDIAGKLINEWARPIFGVTSNFKSMSREEREERDYQNMSKRRRLSSTDEGGRTPRSIDRALQGEKKAARPGEKGFVMRARVPMPSNKDYVVRPKSSIEALDFHRVNKVVSRADRQMRKFKDRNKVKVPTHAATISIEGRKMAL